MLTDGCGERTETTAELENPPLIEAKNHIWPVIAKADAIVVWQTR